MIEGRAGLPERGFVLCCAEHGLAVRRPDIDQPFITPVFVYRVVVTCVFVNITVQIQGLHIAMT